MAESGSNLVLKIPKERPPLLLQLNLDILINIFTFCSPRTLSALSLCSKQLYTICNTDVLWKYMIRYRYQSVSTSLDSHFTSYKSLFQNYCYYIHQLNGLWVLHLYPFNILLRISQSKTNSLESIGLMPELRSINSFNNPIEYREIAQFSYKDNSRDTTKDKLIFSCSGEFECGETIKPLQSLELSKAPNRHLVCEMNPGIIEKIAKQDLYVSQRLSILSKLYKDPNCAISLTKVVISQVATVEAQVLTPGVYQGEYSAHGIELLLVYYQEGKIIANKLAGDPNIPGDEISLKCSHINKLRVSSAVYVDLSLEGAMMCGLPPGYYPDKFIAHYTGEGQIAYTGFYNPTFCSGNMYVADNSTFVFAWDSPLFCYTLFRRCEDLSNECKFV